MNADGLSYLDIASNTLKSGPANLVNGYWSPLYPALISVVLLVVHPRPDLEFPVVHLVNFAVFVLALATYTFFLRRWMAAQAGADAESDTANRYMIPFGFSTFLWTVVHFMGDDGRPGVALCTPDLIVAAMVFLAAGLCCQLTTVIEGRLKPYVGLGLVLALGYYAKAAMLPLGIALFGVLIVWPPSRGFSRMKLMLAVLVFLLIVAPLVAVTSRQVGHLSAGEAGNLNYAWYVNRVQPHIGWTDAEDADYGIPLHPARILMQKPFTLEFASPVSGTYPLWYDPSYWYAGVKPRFVMHQQVVALMESFEALGREALELSPLVAGALVFLGLLASGGRAAKPARRDLWQLTWPIAACGMYALVHVESRFLAAFLVLFWLGIYGVAMPVAEVRTRASVLATVSLMLLIPCLPQLGAAAARGVRDMIRSRPVGQEKIAAVLRDVGLGYGDRLALVGHDIRPYYARMAGVRVVAEIPNPEDFWNLSEDQWNAAKARLETLGVKALVAKERPHDSVGIGWREVTLGDSSHFSVLRLGGWPGGRSRK